MQYLNNLRRHPVSHVITQVKPPTKLRQIIVITMVTAFVLGIYTLLAISSRTARPSTLEADPFGHADEALSPEEAQTSHRFSRDPEAPGRRF